MTRPATPRTPTSTMATRAMPMRLGHERLFLGVLFVVPGRAAASLVVLRCAECPLRGSAIDVLDGLLASRRLALHSVAQEIRQDHVVPVALQAHLDDDDLELAELV